MVDGIGFKVFIRILKSMNIAWVLRTDNDIFKIPKKDEYRYAGVQRCVDYYRQYCTLDQETEDILKTFELQLSNISLKQPLPANVEASEEIIKVLQKHDMYISKSDLENDLYQSPIKDDLIKYFSEKGRNEIVEAMQNRKAGFMYDFLKKEKEKLVNLKNDDISLPLMRCVTIIEGLHDENN